MIDGGRVRIWLYGRTPLDMLETPVIALSGHKESPQRIPKRIEGNDIGVGDGWHCEEGKRGTVIGKGLTAGSSPPYQ
jgi:hypothetical protein